jgi:alkaline phosphatase D
MTGRGALGVEFAGTAVSSGSSFGASIMPEEANVISAALVVANDELQWSEGSYRGFFTLTISPSTLDATYYAMKNVSTCRVLPLHAIVTYV